MKTNRPAFRIGCLILAATTHDHEPVVRPDAGARRRDRDGVGDLQRGGHPGFAARQRARRRRRAARRFARRGCRIPSAWCLDFSGARLAVQKSVIPGVAAPVRGVRLGQFRPDVARVVVDLTAAAPYQILREGPAVVISFDVQPESPVDAPVATTTIASQDAVKPRPNFHYDLSAPRVVPVRAVQESF